MVHRCAKVRTLAREGGLQDVSKRLGIFLCEGIWRVAVDIENPDHLLPSIEDRQNKL